MTNASSHFGAIVAPSREQQLRLRLGRLGLAASWPGQIRGQMYLRRVFSPGVLQSHRRLLWGVSTEDIACAKWRKSSLSNYNGSCVEIARLRADRIGVRDTKDNGSGPVLVFTQDEWGAFLFGAKAGEFDSV
jgi:hypothetical protein